MGYLIDEDGFAITDPALQHPRCVYQLMKAHYSRYTPEMVKTMTTMHALGWKQHSQGSQMIRTGHVQSGDRQQAAWLRSSMHVRDVTPGNQLLPRAMVVQRKTHRPVQLE